VKTSTRYALMLSMTLLVGSVAALAAPNRDGELATRTVRFGDLDLSTAVGAEELYERITLAARLVCRPSASFKSMHKCRARAVEGAVAGVGSPLLSSVHRSTVDRVEELVRR
jgi:UrcA family protein